MTKIKICGVTNDKDALWAANMGVDFLGLNFYKNSPRKISVNMAAKIASSLPEFVKSVGVFVDEEIETVLKVVKKAKLRLVQLHGSETPEYCSELKEKIANSVPANILWEDKMQIIKAFRIGENFQMEQLANYQNVDYFLLDTYVENILGGTGQVFNWDLAVEIKKQGNLFFYPAV